MASYRNKKGQFAQRQRPIIRGPGGRFTKEEGYVFTRIARKRPITIDPTSLSKKSREWFRTEAQKVARVNLQRFMDSHQQKQKGMISGDDMGSMFMFFYDPKHKKTLPYYDKFPLIFPIEPYEDGFLGINMHYLPQFYRAKLMDALYGLLSDKTLDRNSQLKISYKILKGATRLSLFKPCIKRYLNSHVRSAFLKVDAQDWDTVLFLPLARFEKAAASKVWEDSVNQIRGT